MPSWEDQWLVPDSPPVPPPDGGILSFCLSMSREVRRFFSHDFVLLLRVCSSHVVLRPRKLPNTARARRTSGRTRTKHLMLVRGVRPLLPLLLRPPAPVIRMSVGDAAAAANLFANVRLPASILAGALVPLGFGFALPAEGPALAPGTRRAVIRLHRLVAVTSYSCLLLAIVYASVTINGLAESPHQVRRSSILTSMRSPRRNLRPNQLPSPVPTPAVGERDGVDPARVHARVDRHQRHLPPRPLRRPRTGHAALGLGLGLGLGLALGLGSQGEG